MTEKQKILQALKEVHQKAKTQASKVAKGVKTGHTHQSRSDFADGLEAGLNDAVLTIEALPHEPLQLQPDPDLIEILGRPNFACTNISTLLRAAGANIPKKSEMEQAYTLLFLLNLYLKYGNEFRKAANLEINALHEKYIKNG